MENNTKEKSFNYVIMGASSTLGKSLLRKLSIDKSNKILLVSRNEDKEISSFRDDNRIFYLFGIDLLNKENLLILRRKVEEVFENSFNVINCTGYYSKREPFEKTSLEEAKKTFEGNFFTVYNTANSLLPLMKERGGGHFIVFSCNSVIYNYPWMAVFTASKAALQSLAVSLAHEYSQHNIQVNVLRLATIKTLRELAEKPYGDHKNWIDPYELADMIETITKGRFFLMNGASIDLYKPSPIYYYQSYFERNRG